MTWDEMKQRFLDANDAHDEPWDEYVLKGKPLLSISDERGLCSFSMDRRKLLPNSWRLQWSNEDASNLLSDRGLFWEVQGYVPVRVEPFLEWLRGGR